MVCGLEKMERVCVLRLVIGFLALSICAAQVPVNPNMRSFSSAIKGGELYAGKELLLYESNTGEPGVITEQWYTGKKNVCDIDIMRLVYSLPPRFGDNLWSK